MPYTAKRRTWVADWLKGLKKAPDAWCTGGFAMSNQNLKNIFFLPFYLFTFLPLKSTAGNSERSSDGCEEGDCNLQNRFPGICFHHLYFYF